jgi:hypothetical protein
MQKLNNEVLHAASDVVNFLACEHLDTLDLVDLEHELPKHGRGVWRC